MATITKNEIVDAINAIIDAMSVVLDDESKQSNECAIDFACVGYSTRNQLRELVGRLNRCELAEDNAHELGEHVADALQPALDELRENIAHALGEHIGTALQPALDELCESIREEVANEYREGIARAFDELAEASEQLRPRVGSGEAGMSETSALVHITAAMLELLKMKVRA